MSFESKSSVWFPLVGTRSAVRFLAKAVLWGWALRPDSVSYTRAARVVSNMRHGSADLVVQRNGAGTLFIFVEVAGERLVFSNPHLSLVVVCTKYAPRGTGERKFPYDGEDVRGALIAEMERELNTYGMSGKGKNTGIYLWDGEQRLWRALSVWFQGVIAVLSVVDPELHKSSEITEIIAHSDPMRCITGSFFDTIYAETVSLLRSQPQLGDAGFATLPDQTLTFYAKKKGISRLPDFIESYVIRALRAPSAEPEIDRGAP
jgi:hypothetical protein